MVASGQRTTLFDGCFGKRGSSVVRQLPLVLEVPGSIPARGEENLGVRTRFLYSVICRDDTRYVLRPSDRDVNWMSPVQGESPLVQVKEPYGNFDMVTCRLSSCNPECTKYTCR